MPRKKLDAAWTATLIEAVSGPFIAVLFWIVITLIILMACAHGKMFEANIFEAFGAIGQVVFAAAVFWLGKQQFDFTKETAKRQALIDTYSIKKDLLDRFLSLYDITKASEQDVCDETLFDGWYKLADEVSRVFDSDIDIKIAILAERLAELNGDSEYMRSLNEKFSGDMSGMQTALQENWKKISHIYYEV